MNKILIFSKIVLIIIINIQFALAETDFCSMYCGNSCDDDTKNECDNCNANWVEDNDSCRPNSNTGWVLHGTTKDVTGGGGVLLTTYAVSGPLSTSVCGDMTFIQFLSVWRALSVSTQITTNYFEMQIHVGIISLDVTCSNSCSQGQRRWDKPTYHYIQFNDPLNTISNDIIRVDIDTGKKQKKCEMSNYKQFYNRVVQKYTYDAVNTDLSWRFTNTQATMALQWGIKQFIITIRTCHIKCLKCYGSSSTMCTACQSTPVLYWLSGTTCNQTCLNGYGQTSTPQICVKCDVKCLVCYQTSTNCSSCVTSGANTAYLYTPDPLIAHSQCVKICPVGYFANKITFTCDLCNTNCSTCLNSANYCTSCKDSTSGFIFGWSNWICYDPCPAQYFLNGVNCTKCSPYCLECIGSSTTCSSCVLTGTYKSFLYNLSGLLGTCSKTCPQGYPQTFNDTGPNLCLPCDPICTKCMSNPLPCQQCISGHYLYLQECVTLCPAHTFAYNNSLGIGSCLDCNIYCVGLTIRMYHPTSLNQQLYIDMMFSTTIDFLTLDQMTFQQISIQSSSIQYTLDMFDISYQNISSAAYRIKIKPKSYIFLYNATFIVTTQAEPTPIHTSLNGMPFKVENYMKTSQIIWFLIKGPPFTDLQKSIMTSFATLSTTSNNILSSPYVQEIKKSGVFNLLFSGAQITSCSVLSNQIPSQNLYEGVRIWAIFVFFDVPPYEKISNQTKTVISPSVQDRIRNAQQVNKNQNLIKERSLFSTNTMYWRFQRTGQTSFFIFDVYLPAFLIFICWIGVIISVFSKNKKWYKSYSVKLFPIVHKIHQITIMYVTMAAIVEFIYFEPTSTERYISAAICIIFNLYFVCYQLFIYYDFIKYPLAEIGNKIYDYYVIHYGFFLKNIRFQEYDINEQWSPRHWFRPYNYHLLSYYKKFLMMISLPLFYETMYAQMSIMSIIQLLEIIRFIKTWPFYSRGRNYFRVSLEISLFLFFIIHLIQISLLNTIMKGSSDQIGESIKFFYGIGWAGFAFCFYFNVSHVVISIYDLCVSLKVSNREKMDNMRKKYYYNKIKDYEKDNQASSKQIVNRWMRLGNINDKFYGELPELNVRIQFYQIKKQNNNYQLVLKKLSNLILKKKRKYRDVKNMILGQKLEKAVLLTPNSNSKFYHIINAVYQRFEGVHVERIRIKTFLNVWQKNIEQGASIPQNHENLHQKVELISYDNDKQEKQLQCLLDKFPINLKLLQNLEEKKYQFDL